MRFKKPISLTIPTTFLLLGLIGCASQPAPTGELATAEMQIEQAKKENAYQHEPLMIKQAEDKFASAKTLLEQDKNEEAKLLLDEANKDAEAATALSAAKKNKLLFEQSQASLQTLKQQLDNQREPAQSREITP
jgi:hypothetical protein